MNGMAAKVKGKAVVMLEMIQFKLTVFALPFAFTGALLAARGLPEIGTLLLIIAAMVAARTCAMGFNRIADCRFDAANPRTAGRALPAGEVSFTEAWGLVIFSGALFFLACFFINTLALALAPFILGLALLYSLTKRFTSLCHLVVGLVLAISPLGGWVAVTGSFMGYPIALSVGVLFWVAGFDIIYACMDVHFDTGAGLYSLPVRLGVRGAFRLAAFFHLLAFSLFLTTGVLMGLGGWYYLGLTLAAIAFLIQHLLVNPDDLSHIHTSFFSMNGGISVIICVATCIALLMEKI